MRATSLLTVAATFLIAASLSVVAAIYAVDGVENASEIGVRGALDRQGHNWAEVEANGLRVVLSGTAPNEAERFDALSAAGSIVDAARIIDEMAVTPLEDLAAPHFSAEILRNDSGISMIGLVPAATNRGEIVTRLQEIAQGADVADLLQTADYPEPDRWKDAIAFALLALEKLPSSKISVDATMVTITALAASAEARQSLERELEKAAPNGMKVSLHISAPRPVITPFTLRFLLDEAGGRFDACSAQDETAARNITEAAKAAGLTGTAHCTVGMGVPSPNWDRAAALSLDAVHRLGGGSVTMTDADISLVSPAGTPEELFDRVVGELETALPAVFSLHAVLEREETDESAGPSEFYATLSPEGLVQLRGRVSDEALRTLADSFARARFGSDSVYTAARVVEGLPQDWSLRVLAGLEALAHLSNGVVRVTEENLSVRGITEEKDTSAEIARLFATRLGELAAYDLDITYREPPPPQDIPPTPDECIATIATIMDSGQIKFEPGSATIDAASQSTMDAIADVLTECGDLPLEIQGHTDSQGREEMNMSLSQQRAQSVLNELHARRVLTSSFSAIGYGETKPIADNDTAEGRETNRRIEFHLIRPEPTAEEESTLDSLATEAAEPSAPAEEDEVVQTDEETADE